MCDRVPSASYSSVCNVLRQWNISLIPTYRVYRLYDIAKIWAIEQTRKLASLEISPLYCVDGWVGVNIYRVFVFFSILSSFFLLSEELMYAIFHTPNALKE